MIDYYRYFPQDERIVIIAVFLNPSNGQLYQNSMNGLYVPAVGWEYF